MRVDFLEHDLKVENKVFLWGNLLTHFRLGKNLRSDENVHQSWWAQHKVSSTQCSQLETFGKTTKKGEDTWFSFPKAIHLFSPMKWPPSSKILLPFYYVVHYQLCPWKQELGSLLCVVNHYYYRLLLNKFSGFIKHIFLKNLLFFAFFNVE